MEELMHEVEAAAEQLGIKPDSLLQNAANLSGTTWKSWEGGATCHMKTAQRIRDWIKEKGVTQ